MDESQPLEAGRPVEIHAIPSKIERAGTEMVSSSPALMEGDFAMHKPRILIVDDEPSFVRLLKLVLENTGRYLVRKENDADKAVDAAREFKPDLILMDFVMPKVDGVSVAQALRAEEEFSRVPILFLSATVVDNNGFTAQIAGFPAFSKPIGVSQLMHVIDENLVGSA